MSSQAPAPVGPPVLFPGLAPVLAEISRSQPADTDLLRRTLTQLGAPWMASLSAGEPVGGSLLTPGGYPLEFNFSTAHQHLCYTAEPGLPGDSPARKWAGIARLIPGFERCRYPGLETLAAQPGQRFGCWISFRHLSGGLAHKIYQEIAPGAVSAATAEMHARLPGLKNMGLHPLLAGFFPGREQTIEYYCRLRNCTKNVLRDLCNLAGVGRQLPFLLCCLSDLAAESQATLPGRLRLGVSFRCSATGDPALTIFAHAPQLFADNRRARTALLSLTRQLNASMPLYERLTRGYTSAPGFFAHSIVSFKLDPHEAFEMGVGWHPGSALIGAGNGH